jgi:hypothetical protein
MKPWKPIAVCLAAGLFAAAGIETASAQSNSANCNNQPNMAAALTALQAARGSLGQAEQNKGGWRDRAIQAADTAIHETQTGCAFSVSR